MAEVAQDEQLQQRIDGYLDYLLVQWSNIALIADEWSTWDHESRYDFWLEWPIPDGRLAQLNRWRDQGMLSTEQEKRFQKVDRLIAQHRPTLERLFEQI